MNNSKRIVLGCSLGECVHVAGVQNFFSLASEIGYQTIFLGPAVSIEFLIDAIQETNPEIVGVSYRLSPQTAESLLELFIDSIEEAGLKNKSRYLFGGTPPVAKLAKRKQFFEAVFSGLEPIEDVLAVLKGNSKTKGSELEYPQTLIDRIDNNRPFPLLRHHFGLPSIEATVRGIEQIADAKVLDIISLGTDQDAQENFFHPERIENRREGAGGVPVVISL